MGIQKDILLTRCRYTLLYPLHLGQDHHGPIVFRQAAPGVVVVLAHLPRTDDGAVL